MAQQEIPEAWRKEVCAVLKNGRTGSEIGWTEDAGKRYGSDFLNSWQNELYPALIKHFEGPPAPTGCVTNMTKPPGETYEFFFQFKSVKTYGKVLLHTSRKKVMIFSAHRPLKPKLSCE